MALNHLSGNIPSELSSLSELEVIFSDNNRFTGEIPELPSQTNLVSLVLGRNYLTGQIPESIWGLSKLVELSISFNYLSGTISNSISGECCRMNVERYYQ